MFFSYLMFIRHGLVSLADGSGGRSGAVNIMAFGAGFVVTICRGYSMLLCEKNAQRKIRARVDFGVDRSSR
jgi:hypothetical protein